jgi:phosphoglycolate phosphatase
MKPQFIIFDLDGTLIDSSAWLLRAVNQVVAPYVARPWTLEDLLATAGGPEHAVFSRVVPAEVVPAVLTRYQEALREPGSLRIQPGIADLLSALDSRGVSYGLFSGAGRTLGELRLSLVGWDTKFPVRVWGNETAPKPAPDGLHRCLERAGVGREQVTFVGDTEKDSLCAQAAGMRFIGVAWGDRRGAIEACEVVAQSPEELLRFLLPG